MSNRYWQAEEPGEELDRLANSVIGAALEVHRALGPGLPESVYEEALCIDFSLRKIPFARQVLIPVRYKDHIAGDLRLTGHKLGILINFNVPLLKNGIKRLALSKPPGS